MPTGTPRRAADGVLEREGASAASTAPRRRRRSPDGDDHRRPWSGQEPGAAGGRRRQPPNAPTSAMMVMFSPSAVSPPSAKSSAWTTRTTATPEAPGPGADEHRGQRAAEQVPAGAGGDREVEHLHGEDEGGDQPGQRAVRSSSVSAGAAQADADPAAATTPAASDVGALMKPSGMCTCPPSRPRWSRPISCELVASMASLQLYERPPTSATAGSIFRRQGERS